MESNNALYNLFLNAIHEKRKVKVKINTFEKGEIQRICIPFDFWPSKRSKDGKDRYHFNDLDSPDWPHVLSVLPEQLIDLVMLDETFNPEEYVKWTPSWIVPRDWWNYS